MVNKKKQEYISFVEDGQRWMICKQCQSEYCKVDEGTAATTCSMCVQRRCLSKMSLEDMVPSLRKKKTSGRPAGWHFMNEYVDKDGNVFHKGKEQTELKGTLPPTKIKPRRKKKKLSADEKLYKRINDYKKRRKARKKK